MRRTSSASSPGASGTARLAALVRVRAVGVPAPGGVSPRETACWQRKPDLEGREVAAARERLRQAALHG